MNSTEILNQYGMVVAIIFMVVWMLSKIIPMIQKKRNGKANSFYCSDKMEKCITETYIKMLELYKMHDQKDSDGSYVWYVKKSLQDAIEKLADNIDRQTNVFRELSLRLELRGEKDSGPKK